MRRCESRIIPRIRHEQRLPGGDHQACQALADLDSERRHRRLRVAPDRHEHEIVPVHDSNTHRVRVEEGAARLRHAPQERVQRLNAAELPAHLEQRLEPRGKRPQFCRRYGHAILS